MLISTETSSGEKYGGYCERVKAIKDSGFDAFDLTIFPHKVYDLPESFFLRKKTIDEIIAETPEDPEKVMTAEKAKKLREYAEGIGIACNQTHAPYPTAWRGDERYNAFVSEYLKLSIKISGIMGAKVCVVHPCNDYTPEENAKMYRNLTETARESGVKIALENMWNWNYAKNQAAPAACSDEDNFARHLDLLDSDVFVACLDLGHAEMAGLGTSAVKMIRKLGKRIQALHIHDNNLHDDLHTAPYTSGIKFGEIFAALKEVGYTGDITFEANGFLNRLPKELYPCGLRYLRETGEYFRNLLKK